MATAVLILDGDDAPRLRLQIAGTTGTRKYRIDTDDEEEALAAAGLPLPGDPWSLARPTLICQSVDVAYQRGSIHEAVCQYETPGAGSGGGAVVPEPDLAYTERRYTVENEAVYFTVDTVSPVNHAADEPIANGQGASKEVTGVEVSVVIYRTPEVYNTAGDTQLMNLMGTVNSNALTLPPIYGTNVSLTYQPGELRYRMTELGTRNGLVEIRHNFVARPDHLARWQPQDAEGNAVGTQKISRIYPSAVFPQSALT